MSRKQRNAGFVRHLQTTANGTRLGLVAYLGLQSIDGLAGGFANHHPWLEAIECAGRVRLELVPFGIGPLGGRKCTQLHAETGTRRLDGLFGGWRRGGQRRPPSRGLPWRRNRRRGSERLDSQL